MKRFLHQLARLGACSWLLIVNAAVTNAQSAKAESVISPDEQGRLVFKLSHNELEGHIAIHVWVGKKRTESPPLAGTTNVAGTSAAFTPRFPLRNELSYFVEVRRNTNCIRTARVTGKQKRTAPTVIEAVYPSSNAIPENTLRFYLQFSSPMSKGDVYRFIRLRELNGKDIELPFLEIEQEFWSRDSRRLTLLLDPGRIKRGLKPRKEMGPIFLAGKTYELIVDGKWTDSNGTPLGRNFNQRYTATPANRKRMRIRDWKVRPPESLTRNPLIISWPSPLDCGMLKRTIVVENTKGKVIPGKSTVGLHEKSWSFTPSEGWQPDTYAIRIDSTLEDICGNNFQRAFDVDMPSADKTSGNDRPQQKIEFKPNAPRKVQDLE